MPDLVPLSRREATRRIGGWILLTGFVGACGPSNSKQGAVVVTCGGAPSGANTGLVATDLTEGNAALDATNHLILCHDADGLYAMTSICTHAGCDMANNSCCGGAPTAAQQALSPGFTCACHGSQFDANGDVTRGPANQPLQHFKVTIASDGAIWVDSNVTVEAGTRCA